MPKFYLFLVLLGLLTGLSGCYVKLDEDSPLPVYRPLLMSRATLEQSVGLVAPRDIHNVGKIRAQGHFLFVGEVYEGIHIIDNQNPTQPQNIGFLRIPGSLDIVLRGSLLYADNAVDLVTLDLSSPTNVRVLSRLRNALPELAPPEPATIETGYQPANRPADAVVVGWQKVK